MTPSMSSPRRHVLLPAGRGLRGLCRSAWPVDRASFCLLLLAAVFGLARESSAQILQQKLLAPDAGQDDEFGRKVALIPGWAFCSAPYDDDVEGQSGAVYVFKESGTAWSFHQKLKASDPAFGATLGKSLAAWGDWMVVGCPQDDPQGYFSRGSAHVYNLQGETWVHTQKILASDFTSSTQEFFAEEVALRGDRMVIGEEFDDKKGSNAGSAYVFELSGTAWVEVAKLYALDSEVGAKFGGSVAVDGDTLVVGASQEDNGLANSNRGAAYVFERQGGNWVETQKLVASDPKNGDAFGISVAIDGDRILVGSSHTHSLTNDGAMYVFERQGGTWVQIQELLISDPQDGPRMGLHVALQGNLALGSAHGDNDVALNAGSAYLYRRNTSGAWLQCAKFLAFDGGPNDIFSNLAVAIDGSRVLCGARGDDDACPAIPGCNSGAAYVFDFAPDAIQYGSCPWQGPCGNHDDFGGCRTSSGHGGVLNAAGSASVAADDLRFEARWLPQDKLGLFFMGGLATFAPFADGQLCVTSGGMGVWRFNPPQSSGPDGVLTLGPGVVGLSQLLPPGGNIAAGQTWHFQAWFRDPAGPCGLGSNMSNAVRLTFGP